MHEWQGSPPCSTRRRFVLGSIASVGTLLFTEACSSDKSLILPNTSEIFTGIENKEPQPLPVEFSETLDAAYLHRLIAQLQQETGAVENRVRSLINALVWVAAGKQSGTGFMIDESGYYITAGHRFGVWPTGRFVPETQLSVIYEPLHGLVAPIRNFVVDERLDIALIFAPSQRRRKQTPIQLYFGEAGERLWTYALYSTTESSRQLAMGIISGIPGNSPADYGAPPYKDLVFVKGMIPFGGASGGPVVDTRGRIIGILSGAYPDEATTRAQYAGATVSSITGMRVLLEKAQTGRVYTFISPPRIPPGSVLANE